MGYFQYLSIFHLLEFLAALAGTYYLFKKKPENKNIKYLIYFLWLTLVVEIIGIYAGYAYYSDYQKLAFLKGTVFERNYWLFNPKIILEYIVFVLFFRSFLVQKDSKKFLKYLIIFFAITAVLYLIFSGEYFVSISLYNSIVGNIVLMLSIGMYFFELMKSSNIIHFKKLLPVYIAIGVLIFQLGLTPLRIYSKYYSMSLSPEFVALWKPTLIILNVFMYFTFIIGFVYCARKDNHLALNDTTGKWPPNLY